MQEQGAIIIGDILSSKPLSFGTLYPNIRTLNNLSSRMVGSMGRVPVYTVPANNVPAPESKASRVSGKGYPSGGHVNGMGCPA
jgi:hypothetical protein